MSKESTSSDEQLLRLIDGAQIAGVDVSTLRYWIRTDRLPAVKHGKTWWVKRPDLESALQARDQPGPRGKVDSDSAPLRTATAALSRDRSGSSANHEHQAPNLLDNVDR